MVLWEFTYAGEYPCSSSIFRKFLTVPGPMSLAFMCPNHCSILAFRYRKQLRVLFPCSSHHFPSRSENSAASNLREGKYVLSPTCDLRLERISSVTSPLKSVQVVS